MKHSVYVSVCVCVYLPTFSNRGKRRHKVSFSSDCVCMCVCACVYRQNSLHHTQNATKVNISEECVDVCLYVCAEVNESRQY